MCVFFNAAGVKFTGRTAEVEAGEGWTNGIHPEDRAQAVARYRAAFEKHEPFELEYRLRRHDGEYRWILNRGVPIFETTLFSGYVGSCVDIDDLYAANLRLTSVARNLQKVNQELETFAYLASHDLMAPMRTIASFAGLLEEELQENISPEVVRYLNILTKSARNMKRILQDLLDYARLGSKQTNGPVPVDLGAMVTKLMNEEFARTEMTVAVKNAATVIADEQLLKQLFFNLLSNALKFRKPATRAAVDISCESSGMFWRISICDQGVGMEQAFLPRAFNIFTRGESPADLDGTGIGLAMCKKIAEIHDGRIWCQSELGKGSTFIFELPKTQ